jgi:O-antigen ligase
MIKDEELAMSTIRPVTETKDQTFPWKPAILMALLLFIAENHMPAEVIENGASEFQSQMQANVLRQFCYMTIGIIGITYLVRTRSYLIQWRNPVALAWGSLVAWCVLSAIWAGEPLLVFKRIIAYLLMITGAAGLSAACSHKQILRFISLSGAFQLTVGVAAEVATGYFKPWISDYRFAGTQPWNLEGFCLLLFVLSSVAAADADPQRKLFFRCLAVYGLAFLLLTRARGSMMGVTVGLLIYVLLSRSLVARVSFGLAAAISTLLVYMSGISDKLLDFVTRGGEGTTTLTGRQPLWDLAWTFVSARPLTGYGYQDFWTVDLADYFSSELHWENASNTHNIYLDNILTLGYVGLVLHTSLLVLTVVCGSYYYRKTRSPIFALAAAMGAAFLLVGNLETVLLIAPGPFALNSTLLLCVFCLGRKTGPQITRAAR